MHGYHSAESLFCLWERTLPRQGGRGPPSPFADLTSRDVSWYQASNSALLLPPVEEHQLVEVDGLVTGAAAAGPTAHDGLKEQHRLRQRQTGRRTFGSRRSKVRKA